jgi:hypothetical protein
MSHATSGPAGGVVLAGITVLAVTVVLTYRICRATLPARSSRAVPARVQRARPLPAAAPLALSRPASWSRQALAGQIQLIMRTPSKGVS